MLKVETVNNMQYVEICKKKTKETKQVLMKIKKERNAKKGAKKRQRTKDQNLRKETKQNDEEKRETIIVRNATLGSDLTHTSRRFLSFANSMNKF